MTNQAMHTFNIYTYTPAWNISSCINCILFNFQLCLRYDIVLVQTNLFIANLFIAIFFEKLNMRARAHPGWSCDFVNRLARETR